MDKLTFEKANETLANMDETTFELFEKMAQIKNELDNVDPESLDISSVRIAEMRIENVLNSLQYISNMTVPMENFKNHCDDIMRRPVKGE